MSKKKVLTVTTLGLGLSLVARGFLASSRPATAVPGCSARTGTAWHSLNLCGGTGNDCISDTCLRY